MSHEGNFSIKKNLADHQHAYSLWEFLSFKSVEVDAARDRNIIIIHSIPGHLMHFSRTVSVHKCPYFLAQYIVYGEIDLCRNR